MADGGALPPRPISQLLRENHVEDWDSRVLYQLLEFQYRTTKVLLNEARAYALHRNGSALTEEDVRLALELEAGNRAFRRPTEGAVQAINGLALPKVEENFLRLPPGANVYDECLSRLVEEEDDLEAEGHDDAAEEAAAAPKRPSNAAGKYNVKTGKQRLKITAPTSVGGVELQPGAPMEL